MYLRHRSQQLATHNLLGTFSKFEEVKRFSEGLAPVKVGYLWGYINSVGQITIPCRYVVAGEFSNGLARVRIGGSPYWGFINKKGNVVIPRTFLQADDFSENLASVKTGDYMYIDKTGRQVIEERFSAASYFYKGLAHVKLLGNDNRFAYIDASGRHAFTYKP